MFMHFLYGRVTRPYKFGSNRPPLRLGRLSPHDLYLKVTLIPPSKVTFTFLHCVEFVDVSRSDVPHTTDVNKETTDGNPEALSHKAREPVVPLENAPTTLLQWAVLVLNTSNAQLKVERTRHAVSLLQTGKLSSLGRTSTAPTPPQFPPREKGMEIVDGSKVAKRGKGGSAKVSCNLSSFLHDRLVLTILEQNSNATCIG